MKENVVLCGSMKVKDKILEVKEKIENLGYNVILPVECMECLPKEIASRKHFERIISKDNSIILIVNEKNNDIENYIGPNSFAEIAFAFFYNKKIYLLNDYYKPYMDELLGWGVIALRGTLSKIEKSGN